MTARGAREWSDGQANRSARAINAALAQLRAAYHYAQFAGCDPWDFAIEIESLLALGLTTSDLRWLIHKGYIEHAREVTKPEDTSRRFLRCRNLDFPPRTRFVLTDTAWSARHSPQGDVIAFLDPHVLMATESRSLPTCRWPSPCWDCKRRVLSFGQMVVKRFRQPATSQERVLSAFEEEGWPPQIADPLSRSSEQDPKLHLQEVIKSLNHNQQTSLIHFRGDGTGEGVLWERVVEHCCFVVPERRCPKMAT